MGTFFIYKEKQLKEILDMKDYEQERYERLLKNFTNKGHSVLSVDKLYRWDKEVPAKLNGVYGGMLLDAFLEIITILNTGDMEKARIQIERQDHSGQSLRLVCQMIREFCDYGQEFIEYVNSHQQ